MRTFPVLRALPQPSSAAAFLASKDRDRITRKIMRVTAPDALLLRYLFVVRAEPTADQIHNHLLSSPRRGRHAYQTASSRLFYGGFVREGDLPATGDACPEARILIKAPLGLTTVRT